MQPKGGGPVVTRSLTHDLGTMMMATDLNFALSPAYVSSTKCALGFPSCSRRTLPSTLATLTTRCSLHRCNFILPVVWRVVIYYVICEVNCPSETHSTQGDICTFLRRLRQLFASWPSITEQRQLRTFPDFAPATTRDESLYLKWKAGIQSSGFRMMLL